MRVVSKLSLAVAVILLAGGISLSPARADEDVTAAERGMLHLDQRGGIQALLGPGATVPEIGPFASELQYTRWALAMLDVGRDAEAERSLEWAQVRRRVDVEEAAYAAGEPPPPYDSLCERAMCKALRGIGRGDRAIGYTQVRLAIAAINQRLAVERLASVLRDQQVASKGQ